MKQAAIERTRYAIPDYFTNPVIRPYLANVREWQCYIRFLGLPDRRDNPDVLIDRLFVEPLLTRRYVSPDENPENWTGEAETLLDALAEDSPLVLLGDPGIGKSTFLNFVAWLLSRPATNPLIERVGWYLPLPMVLRELPVQGVRDFDGLLDAFLSWKMSEPLLGDERRYLMRTLEEGRAFLLLDGIDELGDRRARENLRNAVFDGFARYPDCRWLLTSRIVGYEEVPFDREHNRPGEGAHQNSSSDDLHGALPRRAPRGSRQALADIEPILGKKETRLLRTPTRWTSGSGRAVIRYVAPFDDRRIAAFARRWYIQREAAAVRAGASASHLVRAVHADESILRLARVPNLLTMMALIHRIEATLPHGRALLYERIAEAYLESIDKFRGLDAGPHDLPRKKGWLARVGFEMQRRRMSERMPQSASILMDADTVKGWLSEEMGRSAAFPDTPSAEEFLKIVGRRSGLFLPRGEGRYAFVHLSFQEYFAAVALKREVTRLRWAKGDASRLGFDRGTLAEWAGQSVWREIFSFLFELLASEEEDDWHADLLDCVFGEDFSRLSDTSSEQEEEILNLGELLARLVTNSRSGLTSERRYLAISCCVRTQLRISSWPLQNIFSILLSEDTQWNELIFGEINRHMQELNIWTLDLTGARISDISPLANFAGLQSLDLAETQISDLSPIKNLTSLRSLSLTRTLISDLSPLANLSALQSVNLIGTGFSDLSPLAELPNLESLKLAAEQISELSSIRGLPSLRSLNLIGTLVSDLTPLANLLALESVDFIRTEISDLSPLAELPNLRSLSLEAASVPDISPLENCTSLRSLELYGTLYGGKMPDLSPLANFSPLRSLTLMGTEISDLSPLAKPPNLRTLCLDVTFVPDISPLGNCTSLRSLELYGGKMPDLSPLAGVVTLRSLVLSAEAMLDLAPLANFSALQEIELYEALTSDLTPLARLASLRRLCLDSVEVSVEAVDALRKVRPDVEIIAKIEDYGPSGQDGAGEEG